MKHSSKIWGDPLGLFILKIGGSAISDKRTGQDYLEEVAMRVARELRRDSSFVIVQGAGYIGHRIAVERRIGRLSDNQEAWAYLRYKVAEAANETIRILVSNELPVIYLPSNAFIRLRDGAISESDYGVLRAYLDRGFIPFMHSDGPIDSEKGLSILSGDAIVSDIASKLGADMVVYGTDVDGVKLNDGRIIRRIDNFDFTGHGFWGSEGDVSGGMKSKVDCARRSGIESRIANLRKDGSLADALRDAR